MTKEQETKRAMEILKLIGSSKVIVNSEIEFSEIPKLKVGDIFVGNTVKSNCNEENCKNCRFNESRDNYCNELKVYGMKYCSKWVSDEDS